MEDHDLTERPDILRVKVPAGEWIKCPQWNEKLGRICDNKLARGRPSTEPQEFKCRWCGKTTIFQRIN